MNRREKDSPRAYTRMYICRHARPSLCKGKITNVVGPRCYTTNGPSWILGFVHLAPSAPFGWVSLARTCIPIITSPRDIRVWCSCFANNRNCSPFDCSEFPCLSRDYIHTDTTVTPTLNLKYLVKKSTTFNWVVGKTLLVFTLSIYYFHRLCVFYYLNLGGYGYRCFAMYTCQLIIPAVYILNNIVSGSCGSHVPWMDWHAPNPGRVIIGWSNLRTYRCLQRE